jgi:hypothetical protein
MSSAAFESTRGFGVAKPSGESNVNCNDLLGISRGLTFVPWLSDCFAATEERDLTYSGITDAVAHAPE